MRVKLNLEGDKNIRGARNDQNGQGPSWERREDREEEKKSSWTIKRTVVEEKKRKVVERKSGKEKTGKGND